MPVAPLSSTSEIEDRRSCAPAPAARRRCESAVCAMCPMVSTENSACWPSMKMKSCPVVLAMRAMSPERASRTIMPSDTPPARMRSLEGFLMSFVLRHRLLPLIRHPEVRAERSLEGRRPGTRDLRWPSSFEARAMRGRPQDDGSKVNANTADSRSSSAARRAGAASPAIPARRRDAACRAGRDARCAPARSRPAW